MLGITESTHKYFHTEYTDRQFVSGTRFVDYFTEPFNAQYWSWVKAIEEIMTTEVFKAQRPHWEPDELWLSEKSMELGWDLVKATQTKYIREYALAGKTGRNKGTEFHKANETLDTRNLKTYNDIDGRDWPVALNKLVEPDTLLWPKTPDQLTPGFAYLENGIFMGQYCGTLDILFLQEYKSAVYASVKDYKTYKSYTFSNRNQTFKHPIQDLQDCKFNRDCLQLSFYAYILEHQYNLFIKDLWVLNKNKVVPLKYLRSHIEKMIRAYEQADSF